jgi:hypothetical protein
MRGETGGESGAQLGTTLRITFTAQPVIEKKEKATPNQSTLHKTL